LFPFLKVEGVGSQVDDDQTKEYHVYETEKDRDKAKDTFGDRGVLVEVVDAHVNSVGYPIDERDQRNLDLIALDRRDGYPIPQSDDQGQSPG
jgi:hypothetical protein